jgi:hypothetical protein
MTDNCLLWSKTENLSSVQTPEIGSGGSVTGTVTYASAKFNKGSQTPNSGGHYIAYTRAGVNINPDALMFSCWIETPYSVTDGVTSDGNNHRFFDWYASNNDRFTCQQTTTSFQCGIVVGGSFILPTFTTGVTWAANTKTYIRVVWDRSTIDSGTETLRLYIDDNEVASSTLTIGTQATAGGNMHIHSVFFGGGPLANSFAGIIDNYKLYNLPSGQTEQLILDDGNNKNNESFGIQIPVGIIASDGTYEDKVNVTWSDGTASNVDAINKYNLYRGTAAGGPYTKIIENIIIKNIDDLSVVVDTKYFYKISGVSVFDQESDLSDFDSGFAQLVTVSPCDRKLPKALFLDEEIDLVQEDYLSELIKIATRKTFQKDQLIINDIQLQVNNSSNFFTPTSNSSPMINRSWRYQPLKIIDADGETIWNGIITDIKRNHVTKKAIITSMDRLKKSRDTIIDYQSSDWEYPSQAAKNIMDAVGFTEYDSGSIETSNNIYEENSFKIKCDFIPDSETTLQSALDKLGAIGCADVYTQNNKVFFRHFRKFEGGSKINITANDMRTSLVVNSDIENLINDYSIAYYNDGGVNTTDEDNNNIGEKSRDKFGTHQLEEIDGRAGSDIMIENKAAAVYIGECNIRRTHKNIDTSPEPLLRLEYDLPGTHKDWIDLESFFDITLADENWTEKPFEVFETIIDYTTNNIKIIGYEVIE